MYDLPPSSFPKEWVHFADDVGEFMSYWGFKKLHGRIWAIAYISSSPITTAHIMKAFSVSKGLVSLALKDLLKYNVLIPQGKADYGTQTYKANEFISEVILDVLKNRELQILKKSQDSLQSLIDLPESARVKANMNLDKMKEVQDMIHCAISNLNSFLSFSPKDLNQLNNLLRQLSYVKGATTNPPGELSKQSSVQQIN